MFDFLFVSVQYYIKKFLVVVGKYYLLWSLYVCYGFLQGELKVGKVLFVYQIKFVNNFLNFLCIVKSLGLF